MIVPGMTAGGSRSLGAGTLHGLLRAGGGAAAARMSEPLRRRWREALGTEGLARRLAWAGGAPAGHTETAPGRGGLLPAAPGPDPSGCLDPAAPIPFEEILLPLVATARDAAERAAGPALRRLGPGARAAQERGLLALLSHVALPVLASEFALTRALAGRLSWLGPAGTDAGYRAFAAAMRAGGLERTLDTYPGLADLLATVAANGAAAWAALATRLDADWRHLDAAFDGGRAGPGGRVETLLPNLSDPHDHGQSATLLVLPGGGRVIHKPRPVDMEQGLGEVLAWANGAGFPWRFSLAGLVPGPGYGWMAHVAPAPCADTAAVARFYARSGGLFCLWWLLQGTDIHHENVIAAGEQPVIVDAETLLHPRLSAETARGLGPGARYGGGTDGDSDADFARALRESGFLPTGACLDLSAWGEGGDRETPFRVARCGGVNADDLRVEAVRYRVPARHNLPVLHGRPVPASEHADAVAAGFSRMARLVREDPEGFRAVLDRFAGRSGRVVLRATNVYGLLLNASLQPDWLREGPARGVLYERLRVAALDGTRPPPCWPLLDAELEALERLDVPRFPSRCDRAAPCWAAPLDEARARIAGLDAAALDRHAAALRRAVAALVPRDPKPEGSPT